MRIIARHWAESGIRTFKPPTWRLWYFNWRNEDFQGDKYRCLTIHLFGRAFQFTKWS